jgi:hypothetical protein
MDNSARTGVKRLRTQNKGLSEHFSVPNSKKSRGKISENLFRRYNTAYNERCKNYQHIPTKGTVMDNNEGTIREKVGKIKDHIKEHKITYITGGICLFTGAVIGGVVTFMNLPKNEWTPLEEYVNGVAAIIQGNRMKNCNTYQTISMYGNVLGRPGTPVVDTTTWKRFESETLAAKSIGATPSAMSKHLNDDGGYTLKGHTFKRVSEFDFE